MLDVLLVPFTKPKILRLRIQCDSELTTDNGECLCLHREEGYFIYRGVVIEPLTDGNEIFTAHRKFCVLKPTAEKDCCVRKPEQLCFGSHAECFSLSGRGFCVHT